MIKKGALVLLTLVGTIIVWAGIFAGGVVLVPKCGLAGTCHGPTMEWVWLILQIIAVIGGLIISFLILRGKKKEKISNND